jgi:hypothetical protein
VHGRRMNSVVAVLALSIAAVGCKPAPNTSATASLPDLTTSLDAARTAFNAHKQDARFLTLLSPT